MSKSKEPEFIPPPLDRKEVQKEIFKDLNKYMFMADLVEEILDRGTQILYHKYLKTKMPQHYADFLTDVSREIITQQIRAYDPGETMENIIFFWSPEDEPTTPGLDSWSRISLKVSQPKPNSPKSTLDSINSLSESSLSTGSKSANIKRIIKSGKADGRSRSTSRGKSARGEEKKQPDPTAHQVEKIPDDPLLKTIKEDPTINRLRDERIVQEKENIIKNEEKRKEAEEKKQRKEAAQKFEKELKGREYTFDFEGKMVIVKNNIPIDNHIMLQPSPTYNVKLPTESKFLPEEKPEIVRLDDEHKVVSPSSRKLQAMIRKQQHDPRRKSQQTEPELEVRADLTKSIKRPSLREVFEVRPGVTIKMDGFQNSGPDLKDGKRMRKIEYMKKLEEMEKERQEYYRNIAEHIGLDPVNEEDGNVRSVKKRGKSEALIAQQLERLNELNRLSGVQIFEQEQLIKMLMDEGDAKFREQELKRIEKAKAKLEQQKKEQEELENALKIENRVTEYKLEDIKKQDAKDEDSARKVRGIHQLIDEFNKKIFKDQVWGVPMTPKGVVGAKVPKVDPNTKSQLKQSVFDGNIPKEPRERATTAQKKLRESGEFDLRKSTAILKTVKPDGTVSKKSIIKAPPENNELKDSRPEKALLELKSVSSFSRPGSALSLKSKSSANISKKPLETVKSDSLSHKSRPVTQGKDKPTVIKK